MTKLLAAAAALALPAAALFAAPAFAQAAPAGVKTTPDGFNDAKDMPLYTYAADTAPNKSTCYGGCATAWPPLAAAEDAKDTGDWTVVTRDDDSKQWAYKGQPLYTFVRDKPGEPATGVSAAWPRAK